MSTMVTVIFAAAAIVVALVLAYVPMRLLVTHMARTISAFIQRQRDRRTVSRSTPDRRKTG